MHTDKNLRHSEVKGFNVKIPEINAMLLIVAFFQAYLYDPWLSTIGPPKLKIELVWDF